MCARVNSIIAANLKQLDDCLHVEPQHLSWASRHVFSQNEIYEKCANLWHCFLIAAMSISESEMIEAPAEGEVEKDNVE